MMAIRRQSSSVRHIRRNVHAKMIEAVEILPPPVNAGKIGDSWNAPYRGVLLLLADNILF